MPLFHNKWRDFLNEGTKRPLTEEELLAEGRKDNVKKKYPELAERGLIDELSLEDPSGNNAYLGWMVKQIAKFFKDETAYAPREQFIAHTLNATRSFHSNKQRMKQKDLNQYKTVADLNQALDSLGLTSKDKRRQQRAREKEVLANMSNIVFENDDIFAVRPLNKEASCIIGQRTKWCISATKSKNYWYDYLSGRNTTDNDGIPRAFVMVQLANLDQDDADYKFALEYKSEPYSDEAEFANAWDAVDDPHDEDHFNEAVAINVLNGALGGEGKGLTFYNRLYRNMYDGGDEIDGDVRDEQLVTVAEYLNDNYADDLGLETIDIDKDDDAWQDDVSDALVENLPQIGYGIIYAGSSNVVEHPPEMDFTEHEEIARKANGEVEGIGFNFHDLGYGDFPDVQYDASLVFEFPGLNWADSADDDEIIEAALEAIEGNSGMPMSYEDRDSLSLNWSGDHSDLIIYFTYSDHEREYGPDPDDFERWIREVEGGFDIESLKGDILEEFENRGLMAVAPGTITPTDMVASLEQTLKNFDQIDYEDGEITAYGDVVVQLPRMPKKFFELSKELGTTDNPGPMYKLKELITGPFRNKGETLVDFMTMKARSAITDYQSAQNVKSAIHRMFGSLGNQAGEQLQLDLSEEKVDPESYIMGDFNFNTVKNQLTYDPVSGKTTIPFYVTFVARKNPEWNMKFLQLADKYWKSIEDTYEIGTAEGLQRTYDKEAREIEEHIRKLKEKPDVKKDSGETMNEHFQGWRNFLK